MIKALIKTISLILLFALVLLAIYQIYVFVNIYLAALVSVPIVVIMYGWYVYSLFL